MKKVFFFSMFIAILSAVIAIWFIFTSDGEVPINWGINGEITSYGSPLYMLIFPVVSLLAVPLLYFTPKIDPKGDNIKKSGPILQVIMIIIAFMMLGIQLFIIAATNGAKISYMNTFLSLLIGLMFIIMGYLTPSIKPNYMIGIRTPWTLYNEEVWTKTHKVSGKWLILCGLMFLGSIIFKSPYDILIPAVAMTPILLGILIYSFILYIKLKKK